MWNVDEEPRGFWVGGAADGEDLKRNVH